MNSFMRATLLAVTIAISVLTGLFVSGVATPRAAPMQTLPFYNDVPTGSINPELVTSIPVDGARHIVMQFHAGPLTKGELLSINGTLCGTNNASQWFGFFGYIIGSTDPNATTGKQMTSKGGENFNPVSYWVGRTDVHHLCLVKQGLWVADGNYPNGLYISYVAWAVTDPANAALKLDIDQGYGRMSLEVKN